MCMIFDMHSKIITMNKYSWSALVFAASILIYSCDNAPKGDDATISEKKEVADGGGQAFTADTAVSRIRFTGHGVGKNHIGTFKLSSGQVTVKGDQLTGGQFIINIKSMELDEKESKFSEKLGPHLMSGDFFDAEKFSTAKFEITSVEPYTKNDTDTSIVDGANFRISGNFTLKDVTKNITFPARIDLDGNDLKARGNFDIDRTQWNMNYGNDKTLKDKFISEKVNIELDLAA